MPHVVLRGFEAPVSEWGPGHRGVDLGAPGGSTVVAAGAGTVTFAAVLAARGVVVVAHPDGLRTTYEPVTPSVRVGAQVARGGPLGRLTLTGSHCLPRACLHWGALRGSVYLDPLTLLGLAPGPVRLLPLGPGGDATSGALPLAPAPPAMRPLAGPGVAGGRPPGRAAGGVPSGATSASRGAGPDLPSGTVTVGLAGPAAAAAVAIPLLRRRRSAGGRAPPQSRAGRSRASRW